MRVQTLLSITAAAISLALAKDSNEELNNIDKSLSRARNEKRKFSSVFYKHPFYIIQNGGGICQVKHNSNTNTDEKSRSKSTPDIVSHISAASSSDATARFNYASTDCAATVVGYNQGAKSVNSILISNKDNYLSNPCAASRKYVIIELCEEIKIDLISMANYEFFSSTFRKLRFSGSDKLLTSPDSKAWGLLGEVEASNTRVLQSFAVKTGFFVKYLLVEILSHWSNEFICPISIVIVNGKTMIEEFKIDMEQKKTNDEATSNIPNSISVDNITVIIESTDNNGQQHLIPYSGYCKIPKYGLVHPTSSIYIRKEDSVTSHSQPNINNNNNSNNLVNNTALPPEDRANIFKSIDHRIKAIEESQIKVLESFSTAEKRLEALVAKLEHKLVKFSEIEQKFSELEKKIDYSAISTILIIVVFYVFVKFLTKLHSFLFYSRTMEPHPKLYSPPLSQSPILSPNSPFCISKLKKVENPYVNAIPQTPPRNDYNDEAYVPDLLNQ